MQKNGKRYNLSVEVEDGEVCVLESNLISTKGNKTVDELVYEFLERVAPEKIDESEAGVKTYTIYAYVEVVTRGAEQLLDGEVVLVEETYPEEPPEEYEDDEDWEDPGEWDDEDYEEELDDDLLIDEVLDGEVFS